MPLNTDQIAVLRTAILAETDPEFVALRDTGATGLMASWLNAEATPAGGKRKVSRGERIFASGTGSRASPGSLSYEGTISDYDVSRVMEA